MKNDNNLLHPKKPPDIRRYRGWWWHTLIRTVLILGVGIFLIYALGQAQRWGWIQSGTGHAEVVSSTGGGDYTCPMHPHISSPKPGRCPECGMALTMRTSSNKNDDPIAVTIDPVARRLANIQTASVERKVVESTIRAPGTLAYDETRLETIISDVQGTIEELYADSTGFRLKKKSRLLKIFSPRLEAAQVAWLESRRSLADLKQSGVESAIRSQEEIIAQARRQLKELGMSEEQIQQLGITGEVQSRVVLHSEVAGTIIKKMVDRGDEVKAGQPLYKVANLQSVWLLLDLFPDDAARIRYGQLVQVEVQSIPGKQFPGRVSFIAPEVNRETRTVEVRVEMANRDEQLRPGDLGRAWLQAPITPQDKTYDPDLVGKWISPVHPEEISFQKQNCPRCGTPMIPAKELGFAQNLQQMPTSLVVPRSAVLHIGDTSIVYVETDPGRFELRPVKVGAMTRQHAVLASGVTEGEQVAVAGNFLIDSQMQFEGKPSLIDTSKYRPDPKKAQIESALAALSEKDRKTARQQKICPVTRMALGSMGVPILMHVMKRNVFICCEGCKDRLKQNPEKYLRNLK